MTTTTKRVLRWLLCSVLDRHTFKPADGTYSSFAHMLMGLRCIRCDKPAEDAYNDLRGAK